MAVIPWTIHRGDALAVLKTLPDASVQCCVTSPPYWGLRDYGTASWSGGDDACEHLAPLPGGFKSSGLAKYDNGMTAEVLEDQVVRRRQQYRDICPDCGARRVDNQLGLEVTPDLYVGRLVEVFREVHRVLRDDGTLWLNLGDSYCASRRGSASPDTSTLTNPKRCLEVTGAPSDKSGPRMGHRSSFRRDRVERMDVPHKAAPAIKPKDLVGIPWRVAFALQADGWWLRSDIIWAKPNCMPSSVEDRPTTAHEYLFLLAKGRRYYYDAAAIREPDVGADHARTVLAGQPSLEPSNGVRSPHRGIRTPEGRDGLGRNRRSVWTICTEPFPGAHFATFPTKLVEPCILAGAPVGGVVLDPFAGAGTTGLVAHRLGRSFIGIELNAEYAAMARRRIVDDCPLFARMARG
jgi:DNA modification methylase